MMSSHFAKCAHKLHISWLISRTSVCLKLPLDHSYYQKVKNIVRATKSHKNATYNANWGCRCGDMNAFRLYAMFMRSFAPENEFAQVHKPTSLLWNRARMPTELVNPKLALGLTKHYSKNIYLYYLTIKYPDIILYNFSKNRSSKHKICYARRWC